MTAPEWVSLAAVGVLLLRALGLVLWRTVEVRRAELRAWDFPPAPPPPPPNVIMRDGVPMARPLGPPPRIDLSGYADAIDGLGAVVQIDRLRVALHEERLVRSALEAENAALRSQLADARGGYR